jgi:KDO2-lipid IV(A) lauroyltransferase
LGDGLTQVFFAPVYRIVYGIFYAFSLLPWRVMYFFSDCLYALVYYVIGYRKKVVMDNLAIVFPEKTEKERVRVAKDFYRNFTDYFFEIIKLISISESEVKKRITGNIELINELPAEVKSISLVSGHFFNWEIANLAVALISRFKVLGVYMPIGNKIFDRLMCEVRGKYGTVLIPATDFKREFVKYARTNFALGLIADQNPGDPAFAHWMPFFGRLTPFLKGPERNSKANNSAVIYGHLYKERRGYYKVDATLITLDPNSFEEGALTKKLVEITEASIRKKPSNYLWSHRRWKWQFDETKHADLVVK